MLSYVIQIFNRYFTIDLKWILLTVLVGIFTYLITRRKNMTRRLYVLPVLAAYVFLMLSYLVFSRNGSGYFKYELTPFWSYKFMYAQHSLILMAIVNVGIYVPIGFMLPTVTKSYRKAILIAFGFSLFCNLLQFVTTTGALETDDVIHNTIGIFIGCWLCHIFRKWLRNHLRKKRFLKQQEAKANSSSAK